MLEPTKDSAETAAIARAIENMVRSLMKDAILYVVFCNQSDTEDSMAQFIISMNMYIGQISFYFLLYDAFLR